MNARSFPYVVEIEVAFRDLDAMGHVNNAVYLSYLETARINFMVDLLDLKGLGELPIILAEQAKGEGDVRARSADSAYRCIRYAA